MSLLLRSSLEMEQRQNSETKVAYDTIVFSYNVYQVSYVL